ncbi:MAG: hypothetical protein K8T90_04265 [Planctomycetes bacterium]|nr:hypothetical protein [Planctomycetota bacterium]
MKPILRLAIPVLAAAGVVAFIALRSVGASDDARAAEGPDVRPEPMAADPWAAPADLAKPVLYFDRWETLTTKDGLPSDRVSSVLAEGDDLFVGTERGFAARRAGKWTTWGKAQGLPHGFVTSVARDPAADVTWLGTMKGLVRISGGKVEVFTQKSSGLQNDVVYHVRVDGALLWCATPAGISVLDTKSGSWSLFDQDNSIMAEPWCYSVATGPERVWFGIWAGGVVELNRRTGAFRDYHDPDGELEVDLLKDDGALHEVTSFISYDSGMLWQTTYFGVARFDGHRWRSYGEKDEGIPGDFVVHVAGRGHTGYIATDQGFGVIDGDANVCVSYKRGKDGRTAVRTLTKGKETDVRTYDTGPASDYATWVQPVADGIWVATGAGLSHGFAAKQ